MDSLRSPRLGRRGRYDYFADFPPFSDLNNRPHSHLHPPFSPLALHPAEPPLPVFPRNHHHETRKAFAHPPGDDFYFPLPYRPNSPGFDPAPFPTPRVSEHAIYHDRPHDNPLPPEIWMRDRGGRGVLENPGVIDERPGRSGPYDNFSKFGGPDPDLMSRRRAEFEQDRFLREDFDWRNQQKLRFWDEQESRCHDPFFQKLPPEAVYLATDPPAFSSSRGLCSAGSVSNRGGEDSRALVHPSPMSRLSYDHSFSDQHIISSNVVENSQLFGNGFGPQQGQSIFTKKNYVRDVPPNNGFGRRQHQEYSNPSMDYEHELEVDRSISKGKRKMPNDRNAKYYARSTKQPMQKPSAFSRLQKGLSVWDRLEKKPLILSPPSSPPCLLPSPPRISNDTEEKLDTIGFSVKSNALVSMIVDPPSIEPSSIKDLSVERPADKPIRIVKKKKKKKSQIRGEAKTHVIVVSAGSSAKQDVVKISNDSSFGSVSVKAEANKVEVSSCMPGNEFVPNKFKKKIKKLPVVKLHRVKEAAKIVSQVEGCTTEIPMMVDCVGAPKFEGGDKYEKEINDCSPNKDTGDKLIDDCCLKDQLTLETPTSDISSMIIINAMNQTKDCAVEIHDDIGEKSLELGKTFDNECRSPYVSDALVVNVNSQPSDYIIPSNKLTLNSVTTHDSSLNMEENAAKNSRKQVKLEVTGSIKPDMPTPDNATTPELLGAGEVFITAGSKTLSYIDDSLICNSAEIEIERPVKKQEKMVFLTATKQPEVPGKHLSSQSCLHDLHDPSFSEISNAAANQKLSNDGIVIENNEFSLPSFNMLPQSGCGMSSQNSSCTPKVYASGVRLEQALPLGPMKMDSPALHLADAFPSHPLYSESTKFINNTSSGYEDKDHRGKCKTFVRTLSSSALKSVHESCNTNNNNQIISENTQVLPFYELNKQTSSSSKLIGEQSSQKKPLSQYEASRFLSNTPKTSVQLKEVARTCQSGRHRTWLRTNTLLHSDENQKRVQTSSNQDSKKLGKVQNSSYIRKGNSLIRKIANEPLPVILPAVGAASRKCKSITERNSVRELRGEFLGNETPSYPLFERPNTPPLPPPSKLSDYTINSCNDFSRLREGNTQPEPVTDEGNQFDVQSKGIPSGNFGSQDTTSFKIVETNNPKRVTYVKHKKNEVFAAPGTEIGDSALTERFQTPIHSSTETKTVPFSRSYLYYRSKRNQLIRSACSSDTQLTGIPAGDANLIDSIQKRKTLPIKRLDVHQKTKKPLISSLVWRLGGDKLSQKSIATLGCQKAFPYLFPWKRSVNWNSFILNDRIPISSRFSLSLISRKLQCLRKRDTIYKRSTDGFSLRKAGVVSIGGSNLKWSKSIEKRSKKASEEATLAVAEVERTKRERKKSKSTCHNGKNKLGLTCKSACYTGQKHDDTRERIFRFGSARYKMDSTKRTLIRIPDDGLLSSTNQQGNNSLKHFVPRRLIIENNEYVRIGNGNQLVRDPKKLKRILASEKIRWSLHTARLKLARKRQYCLFFTRFGKCSKSEGKCPYIHDSSKVAICTKFLKSQCSDINCKLTHKVIPERMPDCSYFLKGLCTNINCPYRHVKVNANAPLCDGFLRGHCADGDECCKKHSYTCPFFEATGKCPQGLLCKLRHPKSQSKSRKRKRTKLKSSNQGRYFCSSLGKAGEPLRVAYSPNDLKDVNDIFCSDGRFTEYINLDSVSDNTGGIENDVLMDSYPGKLNSGYFDMQSCDIDALIKPLRIMNKDDLTIF